MARILRKDSKKRIWKPYLFKISSSGTFSQKLWGSRKLAASTGEHK
jgi:hypothetical protein